MKKNTEGLLVALFFAVILGFGAYATSERGEWTFPTFVGKTVVTAIISGIFLFIATMFKSSELRVVVGIVYVAMMFTYVDRQDRMRQQDYIDLKKAEARSKEFERWYNSLSAYERLEYDNERLREENSQLQNR